MNKTSHPNDVAEQERKRIVQFLWAVFDASTHGASSLMERTIEAVEANDMDDPVRVAVPEVPEKRPQRGPQTFSIKNG